MKFFFILLVVLIGLWFWKQRQGKRRTSSAKPADTSAKSGAKQTLMLRCGVCGTHVPDTEALAGQRGAYCSAEHRRQAEGI
jgi:uncharacterized protein